MIQGVRGSEQRCDRQVALLNQALAQALGTVRRSKRRYYASLGPEWEALRVNLLQHAVEAAQNIDEIAERIIELGGRPVFSDPLSDERSRTGRVTDDELPLPDGIDDDVRATWRAVDVLGEVAAAIDAGDERSRRLVQSIQLKEHQRARALSELRKLL